MTRLFFSNDKQTTLISPNPYPLTPDRWEAGSTMEDFTLTHHGRSPALSPARTRTGSDLAAVLDYTQEVILRHTRHQAVQWGGSHTAGGGLLRQAASVAPTAANCSNCFPVTYRAPLSPPGLEYSHGLGTGTGGADPTSAEQLGLGLATTAWNHSLFRASSSGALHNESWTNATLGGASVAAGNGTLGDALLAGHLVQDVALGIVLGALSMLTFVGNAMVLHAVRTEKRLQSVSNMFIISLAIADLIVGLIVMPIGAIYIFTEEWLFGLVICQFWIGVDYTASTASILNLFILSLDRYWSVTSPLRYMRKRTKKRALIMISLVWFASSLWLIPIIGWHHFEYGGVRTVPQNVCDTEYATNTALKIVTGIFNFYLPLGVMYGLYGKIFMEIRKRSKFELGQRTAGCNVVNHAGKAANNLQATSSLTEDSDQNKSNCDSDTHHSPYVSSPEQRKFLNPHLTTTTEYETETSEDEHAKLHTGQYTNLTLVRLAASERPGGAAVGGCGKALSLNHHVATKEVAGNVNSDIEIKVEYFYDEAVLDQKTEHVHRFYDEHPLERPGGPGGTAETSLSSRTPPGSVVVGDPPQHFAKQEARPANRRQVQAVRKKQSQHRGQGNNSQQAVLTPLGRILHMRHKLAGPAREPHESALRRQAVRWRERWLRQQRKLQAEKLKNQKNQPKPKDSNLKARAKKQINRRMLRPSAALAKEIKAARQLGVIMGAFTLCFLPYFILFMVVAFCDGCVGNSLMTTMTWIGYLNSTMNPFLYPLCNMQFRRKFRKMLNLKTTDGRVVLNTNNSRYFTPRTSIAAYESRCNDY